MSHKSGPSTSRNRRAKERFDWFKERVLLLIRETPNQTSRYYASILGVSTHSASSMLSRLMAKSLVTYDRNWHGHRKTAKALWRLPNQLPYKHLKIARLEEKRKEKRESKINENRLKILNKRLADERKKSLMKKEKQEKINAQLDKFFTDEDKEWFSSLKKKTYSVTEIPIPSYADYFRVNGG